MADEMSQRIEDIKMKSLVEKWTEDLFRNTQTTARDEIAKYKPGDAPRTFGLGFRISGNSENPYVDDIVVTLELRIATVGEKP